MSRLGKEVLAGVTSGPDGPLLPAMGWHENHQVRPPYDPVLTGGTPGTPRTRDRKAHT